MAQEFADKEYYLVDSLVLEELTKDDRELLENSLKIYHKAKDDTSRINSLSQINYSMMHEDWTKFQFFQYRLIKKALKSSPTKDEEKSLMDSYAGALGNIGFIYDSRGDIGKSLDYYLEGIKILKELEDISGLATSLNNIAFIYNNQGDVESALKFFHESLKIQERFDKKDAIAATLNNIGTIHNEQGNYETALKFFLKSLSIKKQINDKTVSTAFLNIASVYEAKGDLENAKDYLQKSLKSAQLYGDVLGEASALKNIGNIYLIEGDTVKAFSIIRQVLRINMAEGSKKGIASSLITLGSLEYITSDLSNAKNHGLQAMEIAQGIGYPEYIKRAAEILYQIYEKQGKGMKALEMYKLHIQMKDSINNEETQKATIRQQTQYEFEKAQIVKENEAKEQARIEAEETSRRNNLQYSLIFLGILVLFVAILMLGFIKVSPNIAEGLIFFAFLILFEFVLVFTEPYLENYTNGEPMYNLLANSVLALVIFPLHAILEKLLKKRIVKS